ncbi:hypothetical protein [Pseudomonas putida]|uniref:Uncharacterized protein n=1 Tax=Pseudomonas putida TaxID=303 RepID=A0A8I1EIM8_PSEPU|nr:hypothetical protein [Pseudomonas putida]MBI6885873.1 hypothetical protein [Pseudomonas putida]
MIDSRLARLKKAKIDLDHALKHNFENLADRADLFIDLLLDITIENPKPATNRQYMAEMFYAQSLGRELIRDLGLYLYRKDQLEKVYRVIQDPLALSGPICWALGCNKESEIYPELQGMMKKCLSLGGIVSGSFATGNTWSNPRDSRKKFDFPSVDDAKSILRNQMKNEWALESNADEYYNYSNFISAFSGYIGDHDPEWAIMFSLEHEDRLNELMGATAGVFEDSNFKLNHLNALILASVTSKTLQELHKQRPELYFEVMGSVFGKKMLEQNVTWYSEFEIADLPFEGRDGRAKLLGIANLCLKCETLDKRKFKDISDCYKNSGHGANMLSDLKKIAETKRIISIIGEYREFIGRESLSLKKISGLKKNFSYIGENFEFVDSLINKPDNAISQNTTTIENHISYIFLKQENISKNFVSKAMITAKTLNAAVVALDSNDDNGIILKHFVKKAFNNPNYYDAVSGLTKENLDRVLRELPEFDKNTLRKINWVDRSIKADFISEDLGV